MGSLVPVNRPRGQSSPSPHLSNLLEELAGKAPSAGSIEFPTVSDRTTEQADNYGHYPA
jgi:hypothetical protein